MIVGAFKASQYQGSHSAQDVRMKIPVIKAEDA